jgi:mono/diheme cytochrome c family protein
MGLPKKISAGYAASISVIAFFFAMVLFIPTAAQEGDDQEQLDLGGQLYVENCAVCHGEDGEGRVGARLAKNWPSIRPDLTVRDTIERGIPGTLMPAWGQASGGPLSEQEIDALTFYLLSWQSGGPIYVFPFETPGPDLALTPPPGVTGDPNRGALLYSSNCAVCHGIEGEGRVGANLAKDWSSTRPDLRIKSVIEMGVEGSVMPAWSHEYGGPLPEQDIDDIVAFILTWSGAETASETGEAAAGPLTGWPVLVTIIGIFVLIIVAIVYYSRQRQAEDVSKT